MEKKQIKMSLWTFYVLVAALVILIGAVVFGWVKVVEKNNATEPIKNQQIEANKATNFKFGEYEVQYDSKDEEEYLNNGYGRESIEFKENNKFDANLGFGTGLSGTYKVENDIINCSVDTFIDGTSEIQEKTSAKFSLKMINDSLLEVVDASESYRIKTIDYSTLKLNEEEKDMTLFPIEKGIKFKYSNELFTKDDDALIEEVKGLYFSDRYLKPMLYKEKELNNKSMIYMVLYEMFYNDNILERATYDEKYNGKLVLTREDLQPTILNFFGLKNKYKDQSFDKFNLTDFDNLTGQVGPIEYKNEKYIIKFINPLEPSSKYDIEEIITKTEKNGNKLKIYVKTAYTYLDMKGLREADLFDMSDEEIEKAGVETVIYKDYDFKNNKPLNEVERSTGTDSQIELLANKLDTYVYTFEFDETMGQYFLTEFSKAE